MARKKQTARKSKRKGNQPHENWPQWVWGMVHGPAPVCQVEDSEDEVAKDISSTEVFKSPVVNDAFECQDCCFRNPHPINTGLTLLESPQDGYNDWVECLECCYVAITQKVLDWHYQQYHESVVDE